MRLSLKTLPVDCPLSPTLGLQMGYYPFSFLPDYSPPFLSKTPVALNLLLSDYTTQHPSFVWSQSLAHNFVPRIFSPWLASLFLQAQIPWSIVNPLAQSPGLFPLSYWLNHTSLSENQVSACSAPLFLCWREIEPCQL